MDDKLWVQKSTDISIKETDKIKAESYDFEEMETEEGFNLTLLDLSNQHFPKADIEGFGSSFTFDSKNFANFLDTINIEYSLKSLVAFGQIVFDISMAEDKEYSYINAHLFFKGRNNPSIKSPCFRSKKKDFLREKINKWILKRYLNLRNDVNVSIIFTDNKDFLTSYTNALDQVTRLLEEKDQMNKCIQENENKSQLDSIIMKRDEEITNMKNIEKELQTENITYKEKIKALENEILFLKDQQIIMANDNQISQMEVQTDLIVPQVENDTLNKELISEGKEDLGTKYRKEIERLNKEYRELKKLNEDLNQDLEKTKSESKKLKIEAEKARQDKKKLENSLTLEKKRIDKVVDELCEKVNELKKIKQLFESKNGLTKRVSQKEANEIMKEFKSYSSKSKCFLWVEDNKPLYEVKEIIDEKINEGKEMRYCILWKDKKVTWEPPENICPELIQEFNQKKWKKQKIEGKGD